MLNDNLLFEFQALGLVTLANIAHLFLFFNSEALVMNLDYSSFSAFKSNVLSYS